MSLSPSVLNDCKLWPVLLDQASISTLKAGSVAIISIVCTELIFFIPCDVFTIGMGHANPDQSITESAILLFLSGVYSIGNSAAHQA